MKIGSAGGLDNRFAARFLLFIAILWPYAKVAEQYKQDSIEKQT